MRKGLSCSEAGKLGAAASKKIQSKQKEERIRKYNRNPKLCPKCNVAILYKKRYNKYCSHSCSASVNNIGVRRHGHRDIENCINCDETLIGKGGKKYCSHKCSHQYQWKLLKRAIVESPNDASKHSIRRFILEERGNACEECGNSEWLEKPIPLDMHHIDGNHKNNSFDNLKLLCPNCHALTPTYKAKNNGNGRAKRRQRYKEGKSY